MNKIVRMPLGKQKPEREGRGQGKSIQDLRDWLARVDALGEMVRISQPVNRDEEMSAIAYLVAKQSRSPAILFECAKGFEKSPIGARHLWNILGPSRKRIALTLEEPAETPTVELIRRTKDKLKRRIAPREVARSEAPIYENSIVGKKIDLDQLPIPRHWPLDGGRYAGTGDAVITRDPDTGYLNIGTYRMMQQGKAQVGLYLSPGKDARLHITRAWQQDKPIAVAAAWGIDPLFMLVGSQTFPKNVSEYEFAGGIKGQPIPVVRGQTTDLLLPANAELVIEGIIRPNSVKVEGPFGEFPGYYGRPEAGCPLVDITAVHYRGKPILTNALMADYPSCEQSGFFSVIRSAKIWDDLDRLGIPGIAGVYSHPAAAGGFGMTVISLEQRHAGHAAQVLALAAQVPGGAYYTKWIIAVDEDIDPTDMDQVIWAMATRCNPIEDIDILRNTWSTWLDPTQNPPEKRPYGSKALINACKEHRHLPVFAKRTALRKEVYEGIAARWSKLGMPGSIPPVRAFETELKATYHEVGGFEPGRQPGERKTDDRKPRRGLQEPFIGALQWDRQKGAALRHAGHARSEEPVVFGLNGVPFRPGAFFEARPSAASGEQVAVSARSGLLWSLRMLTPPDFCGSAKTVLVPFIMLNHGERDVPLPQYGPSFARMVCRRFRER